MKIYGRNITIGGQNSSVGPLFSSIINNTAINSFNTSIIGFGPGTTIAQSAFNQMLNNILFVANRNIIHSNSLYLPACKYIGSSALQLGRLVSKIDLPQCEFIGDFAFSIDYSYKSDTAITSINLPQCKYLGQSIFGYYGSSRIQISSLSLPNAIMMHGTFSGISLYISSINLPKCEYLYDAVFDRASQLTSISIPNCKVMYCSTNHPIFSTSVISYFDLPNIERINDPRDGYFAPLAQYFSPTLNDDFFTKGSYSSYANLILYPVINSWPNSTIEFQNCTCILSFCNNAPNVSLISLPKAEYVGRIISSSCNADQMTINLPNCIGIYGPLIPSSFAGSVDLYMPKCKYIGQSAFVYASWLTNSMFNTFAENIEFISGNGFYRCSKIESAILPQCSMIGYQAFAYASLTYISAPNCVYLGSYAFYHCDSLTAANFPLLSSIPQSAFTYCSLLESAIFPNAISISLSAFAWCGSSTSTGLEIDLPECEFFDDCAFFYASIASLNAPKCRYIGMSCFAFVQAISLSFPLCETVRHDGFLGCKISSLDLPFMSIIEPYAFDQANISNLTLSNCTSIRPYGFRLTCVVNISAPNCKTIGSSAFMSCSTLSSINFPKCTYVYAYAFSANSNLKTVKLASCVSLGIGAFYNCSSISSITLTKCQSIGSYAFCNCKELTNINLPACTRIFNSAFSNCNKVSTYSLPKCRYIRANAFQNNYLLATLSLPSCSSIANNAFVNCSSLSSIYILNASLCKLGTGVFTNSPIAKSTYLGVFGSIYVPSSLLASYKTATNWTTFSKRMVAYA